MKGKVLIVGGGVMGTAIAIETARRSDPLRAPVILFEKSEIGAGSSGDSGAILRQLYSDRRVALMARDSLREYSSFESRTGRSIGFTRSGVLTLVGPEQEDWADTVRTRVAELGELGIQIEIIGLKEIRQLVPGIQLKAGTLGAWESRSGFVDPIRTLSAFATLARGYGTVTRLGVAVEEILVEDGRVVGARTTEGDYTGEQVVVVAGPWSRGILSSLGVELPLRILRPENHFVAMPESEVSDAEASKKHAGLSFDIEDPSESFEPEDAIAARGMHPVVIDLENDFYVRCEPAHVRARIGRTDYGGDAVEGDVPGERGAEISAEACAAFRDDLAGRLPEYAERTDVGSLVSWYTLTPDAQAMIGPVRGIEGLFIVTGFSGHGFKLAPSVGEGVAQMLFDEPITAFDPDFFAPERFEGDVEWGGRFGL